MVVNIIMLSIVDSYLCLFYKKCYPCNVNKSFNFSFSWGSKYFHKRKDSCPETQWSIGTVCCKSSHHLNPSEAKSFVNAPSGSYFEQCLNMHCSFIIPLAFSSGVVPSSDLSLHCTWPPATGLSKILFYCDLSAFWNTHTQHKGLSFYSNQGPLAKWMPKQYTLQDTPFVDKYSLNFSVSLSSSLSSLHVSLEVSFLHTYKYQNCMSVNILVHNYRFGEIVSAFLVEQKHIPVSRFLISLSCSHRAPSPEHNVNAINAIGLNDCKHKRML